MSARNHKTGHTSGDLSSIEPQAQKLIPSLSGPSPSGVFNISLERYFQCLLRQTPPKEILTT